ncbi:hypothetical protein Tco_0826356 [Tanacetum coccineum]
MIELRADVELKDNIVVALPKITREGHCGNLLGVRLVRFLDIFMRNVRRIQVLPNASSSGNKKGVEPTTEVSKSNPFDVLNLVDNDVEFEEFGTIGGLIILVNKAAILQWILFYD